MRTLLATLIALTALASTASAQKFLTKNGHIRFYSEAPLENIEADNRQVTSIMDTETGEIVFSLLMKGFHFEKALMEEHFNEKYVHSDKFPKSTFMGKVNGLGESDLDGGSPVKTTVSGELTIHGVTKSITADAEIEMREGKIYARSVFPLTLADYDITIPGVVRDNISKVVEVTVDMVYDPYNK